MTHLSQSRSLRRRCKGPAQGLGSSISGGARWFNPSQTRPGMAKLKRGLGSMRCTLCGLRRRYVPLRDSPPGGGGQCPVTGATPALQLLGFSGANPPRRSWRFRASKSPPTSLVRSRLPSRSTRIAARPPDGGGTGRVRRRIDEAAEVEVGSSALIEAEVSLSRLRRVRTRASCGDWLANADPVHRGRQPERERERDCVGEELVRSVRVAADGRDAAEGPGPHALDPGQGFAGQVLFFSERSMICLLPTLFAGSRWPRN